MSSRMKNLTGQQFGRLLAIKPTDKRSGRQVVWLCRCECGNLTEVTGTRLRSGETRSCGCLHRDGLIERNFKHGDSCNPALPHRNWEGLMKRVFNPNSPNYKYYGGRGIRVCTEWLGWLTFKEWALSAGYREGLTIDRIDNNGNYCPENCCWVTRSENTRRRWNRLDNKGLQ